MSYEELMIHDRRLVILRILKGAPGKAANCRVLQKMLNPMGHRVSLDLVRTEIAWLEEQGLVKTDPFTASESRSYMVATLTTRGREVADGTITVPGVAEPSLD